MESTEAEVLDNSSFAVTDVLSKSGSSGKCRTISVAFDWIRVPVVISIEWDVSSSTLNLGCSESSSEMVCVVCEWGVLASSTIRDCCLFSVV